jgi:hypothetical protein
MRLRNGAHERALVLDASTGRPRPANSEGILFMSRITIPANPGFYRLELFDGDNHATRSPLIGWRIYDAKEASPICIGGEGYEDERETAVAILTPEGEVYDRLGNAFMSVASWIERETDNFELRARVMKERAAS